MRYIFVLSLIISTSCISKKSCEEKATKLGIDTSVCLTHSGKMKVRNKFIAVADDKIDAKINGFKKDEDKLLNLYTQKLKECRSELKEVKAREPINCVPQLIESENLGWKE